MKKKIILIFLLFISSSIKSQNFPNPATLSTGQGAPNTSEICNDGIDNDNDGFVDGFDPECPCDDITYFNICEPECELDFVPQPFSIAQNWESNSSIIPMSSQVVGDINNDGIQDVLALGINGMTISYPRITSDIKIFSGTTGEILSTIATPFTYWSQLGQIAIADTDSDGFAEIFFASSDFGNTANNSRYIFCYNHDGTLKWKSNAQYGDNAPGISKGGGAIGIADFNYDGVSEVYTYNEIFNAQTGVKLIDGGANGIGHLETSFLNNNNGVFSLSLAADLTSNFGLELAAGKTVYEINLTNSNGLLGNTVNIIQSPIDVDGFTAIADINLDGNLDVVVSSAGNNTESVLYVWNPNNSSLIGSINLPSGNQYDLVSVPFIGDMDSDGKPEIGLTRPFKLLAYKFNDLNNNLEQFWELETSDVSGLTKLSMFDFNQDGTQELVYRDETQLRIIDGSTTIPQTLASIPSLSGTAAEGPIITDINNDNQAEIIIGSEDPNTPFVGSLISYKTNSSPWAPARKVWNQYGYFNVNIKDDLSVPIQQQNHGLQFYETLGSCLGSTLRPLNSFMAQETIRDVSGCPIYPAPDLIVNGLENITYDCINEVTTFDVSIGNIGSTAVASSFNILIYEGTFISPGSLVQSQTVTTTIAPLDQGSVSISVTDFSLTDFFVLLNFDDSSQNYPYLGVNECNYLNNYMDGVLTPPTTTPTFTQVSAICSGDILTVLPTTSTNGILGSWSPALDNTVTTTYTFTPDAGQCAETQTMTITVNPNITPTFTQVQPINQGTFLSELPTTSTNGIIGNWSPALNNMATTTYTFTPIAGQCTTLVTMTIIVNPLICSGTSGNQLINPSFELPAQPNIGNNFLTWPIEGWDGFGAIPNVVKTNGFISTGGPINAQSGVQYLDIVGSEADFYQEFEFYCNTQVFFSGYFSVRDNISSTGRIDLLRVNSDNTTTLIASSNQLNMPSTPNIWYLASGSTVLQPGSYRFNITMGQNSNFDNACFSYDNINIDTGSYGPLCEDSSIQLTGLPTDSFGSWSGIGITDNGDGTASFNPSGLGGTIVTATYNYYDEFGVGCTQTTDIIINSSPNIEVLPSYVLCDDSNVGDLEETFDLSTIDTTVIGTQTGVVLSYHATLQEAQSNISPLPTLYSSSSQTIYVALENTTTGCRTVAPLDLVVSPIPENFHTQEINICDYTNVSDLFNDYPDINVYNSPNSIQPLNPSTNLNVGTYYISQLNQFGCESVDIIDVYMSCFPNIPNGFSPNGDGLNDYFNIQNLYDVYTEHKLKIFNRYGTLIFEGDNSKKWEGYSESSGDIVPVGTYFYYLVLNNLNNDTFTGWVYINY